MRRPRLVMTPTEDAYYHCVTWLVNPQVPLSDEERDQFRVWMREYEKFCGVRVITYCLLGTRVHLFVHVPPAPKKSFSDEDLLERLEELTCKAEMPSLRQRLEHHRQRGHANAAEDVRQGILNRMFDLGHFLKALKQRFSVWYNHRHHRRGTMWAARFKSVIVEGTAPALATTAAYVDLTPVREGLVNRPERYDWCGYAEAVRGGEHAMAGYEAIFAGYRERRPDVLETYRMWLFGEGEKTEGTVPKAGQPLPDAKQVEETLASKGKMTLHDFLRCDVRYFIDGQVIGGRDFVESITADFRRKYRIKRKHGAREMAALDQPLFAMRNLQKQPITPAAAKLSEPED